MSEVSAVLQAATGVFGVMGWLLYFREHRRSRDYVTDLLQLVNDYDLTREDLRRSIGWNEVEKNLERGNNG